MSLLGGLRRCSAENDDLERVEEAVEDDNAASGHDSNQSEAEEAPQRVEPPSEKKIKIVKNPRPTLNPKRLLGPRGIQILEETFRNQAFQGRNYEKQDLDVVMKKLEYWAHRLYPKFQFDDCVQRISHLGKKKEVSTHIKKIRLNMLNDENEIIQKSDDEETNILPEAPVLDEFDILLNQQIALARSTPCSNTNASYEPSKKNTFIDEEIQTNDTRPNCEIEISSEQRERMLQNKKIAEERRLLRIKNNSAL